MKTMSLIAIILMATGCVTSPTDYQPEFEASSVLERIGGLDETPEWATGMTPFLEERGDVIYVNTLSMSGDSRPEACSRAAANVGRMKILREIKDNITSSGQFSEMSASSDPAVDTLIAFLSQGSLTGVKVTARYWEKREESDTKGMRVLRLHCAVKVAIARNHLERQISEVIDGVKGGDPEIRKKLKDAHKNFIDGVAAAH